ncbi:MAG: SGNH/GDSL hydrolase family protein [Sphingomonas sp.]
MSMNGQWSRREALKSAGALWMIGGVADTAWAQSQQAPVYTDAATLPMIGRAFPDRPSGWQRIEPGAYPDLPPAVKERLTHSAGLAVSFRTDSPILTARWCTADAAQNANLTPIAQRGLDLYIRRGTQWIWAGVGRPDNDKACNEDKLVQDMDAGEKECLLYLPLYKELKKLEIGVAPGSALKPGANPFRKRVAIYGSSIVQGAAASRPGMAYPARLSRRLGVDVINLGVSGVARMEPAAARMVADVEADAYMLDCVPNTNPGLIAQRAGNLIRTVRSRRPKAPIIVVMSIIRELGHFNQVWAKHVADQNATMLAEVNKLTDLRDITVIPADDMLGHDGESSVDGTHPSDIGFDRMLQVIGPVVAGVLKRQGIL